MAKVTFNNKNRIFYNALKSSVEEYFSEHRIQKTGNWRLYQKTIVLVPAVVLIYLGLLFLSLPVWLSLVLCGIFGFLLACIGFNVMHDACHGSYSSKGWVNDLMGLSMNALGSSAFMWKQKHNIIHHTYTNVDGVDDDIANHPFLRQCATQDWRPFHRVQHIYLPLAYGFTSIAMILVLDFTKYFSKRIHTTHLKRMDVKEHVIFWFTKLLYGVFYILLPILLLGWLPWLIGFLVMHLVMGFTLAIVFQLAHVVEETEFEFVAIDDKKIENEWAIHQVKTTANFAPRNKIISWFVGGLNYQVEHHLFPRISHIHYPAISRIVRNCCDQFNLPYHQYPTMMGAIRSHFRIMRALGRRPALA